MLLQLERNAGQRKRSACAGIASTTSLFVSDAAVARSRREGARLAQTLTDLIAVVSELKVVRSSDAT